MKFNYEKFRTDSNFSDLYEKWDKHLLDVLQQAGCPRPTYDFHAHIFTLWIERKPTAKGRHRQSIGIEIICPNDGKVQIKVDNRMKSDEIQIAVEKAIEFLSIMESSGYISIVE